MPVKRPAFPTRSLVATLFLVALMVCGPLLTAASCATFKCAAQHLRIPVGTYLDQTAHYADTEAPTEIARIIAANFSAVWVSSAWSEDEPQPGRYDFSGMDWQVRWALKRGVEPWGHALIYNPEEAAELLPAWLKNETRPERLKEHFKRRIQTLMTRYKGKVKRWIVLNEAYKSAGHGDTWQARLGNYAPFVFQVAREADPAATLIYNEAFNENAEGFYSENRATTDQIIRELTARRLLDMMCFQTHLHATEPLKVPEFVAYMKSLRDQRLQVCVSELDVSLKGYRGPQKYQYQANQVSEAVKAALRVPVAALFIWDVGDVNGNSWLGADADPTPWDKELKPKPAFYAILRALAGGTK
jgi:endo-1,4-beta-xylanase